MSEHSEVVRTVAQSSSVLILVHDHIQAPVQPVFNAPVLADNGVESFWRQSRAEQVVGGLGGDFFRRFAYPNHLADGLQAGPLMLFLKPVNVGRNRRRAGLDSAVVALHPGSSRSKITSSCSVPWLPFSASV